MIVVTGATGFIGSNLVHALVERGHTDLLVVDNIAADTPLRHLEDLSLPDRVDKDRFLEMVERDDDNLEPVDFVFHQGACTDTTERDRDFIADHRVQDTVRALKRKKRGGDRRQVRRAVLVLGRSRAGCRRRLHAPSAAGDSASGRRQELEHITAMYEQLAEMRKRRLSLTEKLKDEKPADSNP